MSLFCIDEVAVLQCPARDFLVVDPMHNLFLGTANHFLKAVWLESGVISQAQFEIIQHRVDLATTPSGIGRIPNKISSGFSSFTADQWKHWVVYFSHILA